jgi:enamine deaminase RidA (YjgF/YER057c/UK114 family)
VVAVRVEAVQVRQVGLTPAAQTVTQVAQEFLTQLLARLSLMAAVVAVGVLHQAVQAVQAVVVMAEILQTLQMEQQI